MTLGLYLYKTITLLIAPFLGVFFRGRVRSGKEAEGRLSERRAVGLPPRPTGRLIWLHAASVGNRHDLDTQRLPLMLYIWSGGANVAEHTPT